MYLALGVDNIEALLPPPPQPQPTDPGLENSISLLGKPLKAFEGQDHQAHIDAHRAFMSSMLVKSNLPVMSILQAHISEHISLMARQAVMEQMAPQMQQMQMAPQMQQDPQAQQQMQQMQTQMEAAIAKQIAEMTNNMVAEEQEMMEGMGEDSLVELRKKELDLQAAEIRRKEKSDENQMALDLLKVKQKEKLQDEKIDSTEDIAQLRAAVTLEKMNAARRS